jgi:anti-anti-sigma factor
MSILNFQCNDDQVVSISGDFDVNSVGDARELFEALAVQGSDVVVDLTDVRFIDSSGIGAIVFLYKRLVAQKHNMALVGVNGQPKELLAILKISQTIDVFMNLNHYLADKSTVH